MISIFCVDDKNTVIEPAHLLFIIKHHIVLFCPLVSFCHSPDRKPRALSVPQEQAQLLCGKDLPERLLAALLTGTKVGKSVMVVNLSPYDAWLERACMEWSIGNPDREIKSLSLGFSLATVSYSEKLCAMHLLEDWFWKKSIEWIHNVLLSRYTQVADEHH